MISANNFGRILHAASAGIAAAALLAGCADSLFVSNVPDYLQNNDQARVTIVSGDSRLGGGSHQTIVTPQMQEMWQAQAMALATAMAEALEKQRLDKAKLDTAANAAKRKNAPPPVAESPSAAISTSNAGAMESVAAKKQGFWSSIFSRGIKSGVRPSADKDSSSGQPAKPDERPAAGPEVLTEGVGVPTVLPSPPAGAAEISAAEVPLPAESDNRAANCESGEVLTRMNSGDYACCPKNGEVCYVLADTPAPPSCLERENLTKMSSGEYACCPDGGEVCYRAAN
ncbi:MAG: hypothetical protein LBB08_02290 [Rickettsiales bacterium]|jgi:hypothetical protein|nr:hypothetical protein [Rickettsiales bacterium]